MAPSHSRIKNPKMDQDFFTSLPTEIMFDIVLRLPTRSIMSCKCVCKSWRDLIKTPEFVESHSSRSVLCLALQDNTRISKPYKIIEFVDFQNSWQNQRNVGLNFSFPHRTMFHSSANGLLFLSTSAGLFICNPITREYIELPLPSEIFAINHVYGFGASKLSGEYKVVRLFSERQNRRLNPPRKCEVYSLRRGLWRSVATTGDQLQYARGLSIAVFSNGNLHWLVAPYYETRLQRILCFDLETECFSSFSVPRLDLYDRHVCALGDSLCLSDYSSLDGLVIWLMNKYGDDKSWTKEFFIKTQFPKDLGVGVVVPIKVFKNGDILFVRRQVSFKLYFYSSKSKKIRVSDAVESLTRPCIYKPSFLPLKTLAMENDVIEHW